MEQLSYCCNIYQINATDKYSWQSGKVHREVGWVGWGCSGVWLKDWAGADGAAIGCLYRQIGALKLPDLRDLGLSRVAADEGDFGYFAHKEQ